jgi:hypothetical protein
MSRKAKIMRELFDNEEYSMLIWLYASLYRDTGNADYAMMACRLVDNIDVGEDE